MTGLLEEGRAADIVCLEFWEAIGSASYKTTTDKLLYMACMSRHWGRLKLTEWSDPERGDKQCKV